MILVCLICKRELPEGTTENICHRNRCKNILQAQQDLNARIADFSEFWKSKTPNEGNYKIYLESCKLEEEYQFFIAKFSDDEMIPSRRTWFHLNIGLPHARSNWPDEFGRIFNDGE